MDPLISAADLVNMSAGPRPPVILDVRWRLGGEPGRRLYEAGHVPGARYVDLDTELAGVPGDRGRHPLPEPEVLTAAMRRAGVDTDSDVVVYDDWQGWGAARAWWLLRWAGHERVRVLDGGLASWMAVGRPPETGESPVGHGSFTARPGGMPVLSADEASALARSGLLLDARAPERYRGDVEPIDRVGGHIPGAVNAPTTRNVTETGLLLPAGELRERFAALGADGSTEVGVYCGSGVSGAHEVLALAAAGIPAALYPGSWSEWTADESRPVATGAERG